ncbi:MAG: fasciclin domain-containing protein [Myxococcota bacterium]
MKRILLTLCLAGATACASTGPGANPASGPSSIVDVAVGDGRFTTLVAALKAAGLDQTLAAEGPYTVFAPTDEAFKALPPGTVEGLLKPEAKDKLKMLLTHHVVAAKVTADDVSGLGGADTMAGTTLGIEVDKGAVKVGGANVVAADVMGANGVIHVIDKVLIPADMNE